MKVNVITLYEGHYHYGVASLINSLIACGFAGKVTLHYKDDLPPWALNLKKISDDIFQVKDCFLHFKKTHINRHFGYHKPFAALEELDQNPDCDAVIYADPDILFLAPWAFYEDWLGMGLALCQDVNFPSIAENHPWRKTWKNLLTRATGEDSIPTSSYANSGFFGLTRSDIDFLRLWTAITEKFEEESGNTASFDMNNRHKPIVGDQDLMAATLMGWKKPVSLLGLEGMGFNNHHFILTHNIRAPKPWRRYHTLEALKGMPPSIGETIYLKFSNSPISPYASGELARKQWDFRLAKLISRLWSR